MVIDIISYTDSQFAALTEEQLLQVKSAQLKKNRLQAKLEEDLQHAKQKFVENIIDGGFLYFLMLKEKQKMDILIVGGIT